MLYFKPFFNFTVFLNFNNLTVLLLNENNVSIFRIYKQSFSFQTPSSIEQYIPGLRFNSLDDEYTPKPFAQCCKIKKNLFFIELLHVYLVKKVMRFKQYIFLIKKKTIQYNLDMLIRKLNSFLIASSLFTNKEISREFLAVRTG